MFSPPPLLTADSYIMFWQTLKTFCKIMHRKWVSYCIHLSTAYIQYFFCGHLHYVRNDTSDFCCDNKPFTSQNEFLMRFYHSVYMLGLNWHKFFVRCQLLMVKSVYIQDLNWHQLLVRCQLLMVKSSATNYFK
jgi:hypothetical protein